jgi:transcriptional regulator with XRE-family HTH domain
MPYSKANRVLGEVGIGSALRKARERCGKSQEELAVLAGMSASSIHHIEMGADFKTSTLLRLAAQCGLEVVIVPKDAVPYLKSVLDDMAD